MSKHTLEIGVPLTLLALGAATTFALSGLSPEKMAAYQAQISTYVADFREGWESAGPELAEVAPSPASVAGQTPLAAALAIENVRPPVETYMPAAPAGWTKDLTAPGDYLAMAGVPPIDWAVVNPAVADLERQMMAHITTQAQLRSRDRGVERSQMTYRQGDQIVLVSLRYVPTTTFDGPAGAEFALLQQMMRDLCETEYGTAETREVQNVAFDGTAIEGSYDGRRFVGFIGPQIDIKVWTNADDDAVDAVLAGMDISGLQQIVEIPA